MRDVCDRIQREGDQQRRKGSVQPTWKSSREPEGAHGSEITECANRLRHASPACKAPEARILELREIDSLAVVMLPARLVQLTIAFGPPDDRPLRRTTKLLPCIALGLALFLAQAAALLHSTDHAATRSIRPGCIRSCAMPACPSRRFSRWRVARARCPCCPRRSSPIWSTSRIASLVDRASSRARFIPALLHAASSTPIVPGR